MPQVMKAEALDRSNFDDPEDLAFFGAFFEMLYETGWDPLKPNRPPANMPVPEKFFTALRFGPGAVPGLSIADGGKIRHASGAEELFTRESGFTFFSE